MRQLGKALQSLGRRFCQAVKLTSHAGAEDVQRTMYSLGNSITSEDFSDQACKKERHRSPVGQGTAILKTIPNAACQRFQQAEKWE